MITVENLTVTYRNRPVLENLQLSMQEGCIHGIAGLNGSGKTTFLNAIYGFLTPASGRVLLGTHPLHKKQMGYLESQQFFYSGITGLEYLNLFPDNSGHFNLKSWLELFHLPLGQLIDSYSLGMKKKLALLAVLKLDKPVLILDEPFNGLDMEASYIVQSVLLKLKEKGKTILLTSHVLDTLVNTCDFIHYLSGKKINRSYAKVQFSELEESIRTTLAAKTEELISSVV